VVAGTGRPSPTFAPGELASLSRREYGREGDSRKARRSAEDLARAHPLSTSPSRSIRSSKCGTCERRQELQSCPARSWKRAFEPGEGLSEQSWRLLDANRDSEIGHCGCDHSQYTLPDRDRLRPSDPSGRLDSRSRRRGECLNAPGCASKQERTSSFSAPNIYMFWSAFVLKE
jgi:hypothetical protein